jgi:hypothetical protein
MRPSVRGVASGAGQADVSFALPAHQPNDIILIAIETANQPPTTTGNSAMSANGYTWIPPGVGGPAPGQGTAAAANATRLLLYWKRATTSAEAGVFVDDTGDHQSVAAVVIQDANTTIDPPWETAQNTQITSSTTSLSFASLTTTKANTLIVHVVGNDADAAGNQMGTPTNATLTNLTEWVDVGTTAQDGGVIGVITGDFVGSGSTGNTTLTLTTSEIFSTWTAAFFGEPDIEAFPWAQAVVF